MKLQHSIRRLVPSGILASGLVLFGVACSGDATNPDTGGVTPFVTASVAGVEWKANYQVQVAIGDLFNSAHRVEIVGLEIAPSFAGRQVTLILDDFTGPRSYALGPQSSGTWGSYVTSSDVRSHAEEVIFSTQRVGAGTVIVTSFDAATGRIAGTFSAEVALTDTPTSIVQIANGSFEGHLAPGD